jgi:integrase/transposase
MRKIERILVSDADRERLEGLVRDRNTPQKVVWRARIVLGAAAGLNAVGIAATVGKSVLTVRRWRRRFVSKGVDGLLKDAPRPPRRKPLTAEKIKQVVDMTLHQVPPNATHWSVRTMATAAGISYSSVQRIWHAHELKPHLTRSFKVSRDPNFVEKVEDVVGLYLNPPSKALVLSVDEKSQIQALDRTQPGLPIKKGRAGTMTHDYKRNGTTTLFAALNMLDGKVIGACMPRHRAREFLLFLEQIDNQTPADLALHLIVDNYATHKTAAVKRWLKKHKRFHLHFIPTSASWLNMVERFFAEITQKADSPRRVYKRPRAGEHDHGLSRQPQRRPQALHLDKDRRPNLRKGGAGETSVRVTTLALGVELMDRAEAETTAAGTIRVDHAKIFRDGLIIAMLAEIPLRLGTLIKLTIGKKLVRSGDIWILDIPAEDTKTRVPLEYSVSPSLSVRIHTYLNKFRPRFPGAETQDALWLSLRKRGRPLTASQIYRSVVLRTTAAFGFAVNPHRFRHAAATFWGERDPANVRGAKDLLGHASFQMTEKHYNMAKSHNAGRKLAKVIDRARSSIRPQLRRRTQPLRRAG